MADADAAPALPAVYELTTVAKDLQPAVDRVDVVLLAHEPVHRGAWRGQSPREHLEHLIAHAEEALRLLPYEGVGYELVLEEELAHAATRGLMVLALVLAQARGER